MSSVLTPNPASSLWRDDWVKWFPVVAGLLILYIPSYMDLARVFWRTDVGEHGPIVLAIVLWLIWRSRSALVDRQDIPRPAFGWTLIVVGLLLYAIGRSQEFFQFEIGSQIPLLAGVLLAISGRHALKRLWFALFFMCFLVPVPNAIIDAVLLSLKQDVSMIVETLLYWGSYPVARSGVVLTIGPYQLLIANACSGLNSMIALSAVGVLFVYLMKHSSRLHNAILLASVLPIAFLANIVRVTGLMLITYYFGDGAGHDFHDIAGYFEIVFAFGAFFAWDALLTRLFFRAPAAVRGAAGGSPRTRASSSA